jgi:hypothetical protein
MSFGELDPREAIARRLKNSRSLAKRAITRSAAPTVVARARPPGNDTGINQDYDRQHPPRYTTITNSRLVDLVFSRRSSQR